MFESAEIGEKLDRETFATRAPVVREELLDAQARLSESGLSVVVVIAGVEGSGKGETVNFLLKWLDVRGVETHAMGVSTDGDSERPDSCQFWRRLPPKGKIAIFFGSWYTQPIIDRIEGKTTDSQLDQSMHKVVDFERMLVNEGTVLVKFWMHITKKQQRRIFKRLERDPDQAWRVSSRDWKLHKSYERFIGVAARTIRQTSSGEAAWHIIEAKDRRYRQMAIAERLVQAINLRIQTPVSPAPQSLPVAKIPNKNIINSLDLTQSLSAGEYKHDLGRLQNALGRLGREMTQANGSAILVFEGVDAAGKGGCIRRIAESLDARFYRVVPVSAPTDEERARPYLWRFWRTIPRRGHFRIYDRSWYGRVLVERIEQLCSTQDWKRAYSEINAFEDELASFGIVIIKFWLAISNETQLRRFQERESMTYKRYKITSEDWRNREKWLAYENAASEMVEQTSTEIAPWTLIEAEDKKFARIKVLQTVYSRIQEAIENRQPFKSKRKRTKD